MPINGDEFSVFDLEELDYEYSSDDSEEEKSTETCRKECLQVEKSGGTLKLNRTKYLKKYDHLPLNPNFKRKWRRKTMKWLWLWRICSRDYIFQLCHRMYEIKRNDDEMSKNAQHTFRQSSNKRIHCKIHSSRNQHNVPDKSFIIHNETKNCEHNTHTHNENVQEEELKMMMDISVAVNNELCTNT